MADQCCSGKSGKTALNDPKWRRVLWIALIVNAAIERRESCGAHSRIDEPIHASLSPQTRRNCESVATSAGLCSVERE